MASVMIPSPKYAALIRISVPYTGMIISTRESQAVREKVLPLGVSQISGASKTSVGGYADPEAEKNAEATSEQFDVSDQRTLDEVVNWLMKMDYIPSFCTACYREGRTGDRFMALCKSMQILNCCHPNALMTLKEYLEDYASPQTRELGMKLIDREIEKITNPKVKQTCYEHIHDIARTESVISVSKGGHMGNFNETPSANRLHIGIYGKTNSGKSSLINAVTKQEVSIVADVAGTTTDPVYKPMRRYIRSDRA